jgi:crotonobetainyl-CoA:carnitine CoA-transferase CaiB-like acyl-CoA transferase
MANQALAGIRIADLTIITAGACTTQILADLGADVVKVEAGRYPDPFRSWQGAAAAGGDIPDPWNHAPTFNMVNRNKRGVTLDLKSDEGREAFLQLVEVSDAVTENFRQGVMDRLGVGYEVLKKRNPNIGMLSLGSQGGSGPERHYGSYGSTLDCLGGLTSVTGYPDSHPVWSSQEVNYPDQVASIFGAGLVLAGIRQRNKTGEGCYIDLSQREMVTTMIGEYALEYNVDGRLHKPDGNSHPQLVPNDCYRCSGDQNWVAISVATEAEWRALCDVIGKSDLGTADGFRTPAERSRKSDEIRSAIESWTGSKTKYEAMDALQNAGIRAAAVLTGKDMLENEHLWARNYYQKVENHRSGTQTLRLSPFQLSKTPARINNPAPVLGMDTDTVLKEVLGYSEDKITKLRDDGVTANTPKSRSA